MVRSTRQAFALAVIGTGGFDGILGTSLLLCYLSALLILLPATFLFSDIVFVEMSSG